MIDRQEGITVEGQAAVKSQGDLGLIKNHQTLGNNNNRNYKK